MTPQYCIVNECLVLLKQVDMQPIKKLRIEIQLMQMKRVLLDDNFPLESCKDPLREVLFDIRRIRKGEHDTDTVSSLMERMGRIMNLPRCEG